VPGVTRLANQPHAFTSQATTLIVIEPGLFAQELFENSYFFLQIFDHVLLVPIHPTSQAHEHKGKRIHNGIIEIFGQNRQHQEYPSSPPEHATIAVQIRIFGPTGLANQLIRPEASAFPVGGIICRRKRLGGLLNYYYREATA
jgi:hypothetical protein